MLQQVHRDQGAGHVAEPLVLQVTEETTVGQAVRILFQKVVELVRIMNGGLSLGTGAPYTGAGNLDAVYVEATSPLANEEFEVWHGLGRIPCGYDVTRKDKAASVYDSSVGSWNQTTLFLKCDTKAATVTLRIY